MGVDGHLLVVVFCIECWDYAQRKTTACVRILLILDPGMWLVLLGKNWNSEREARSPIRRGVRGPLKGPGKILKSRCSVVHSKPILGHVLPRNIMKFLTPHGIHLCLFSLSTGFLHRIRQACTCFESFTWVRRAFPTGCISGIINYKTSTELSQE